MNNSLESAPASNYWVHKWKFHPLPWEVAVITSVLSAILGFLGAVANGLVMFLVVQIRKFHQLQNLDILIVSLCFSDFLSSVVVQPVLIKRMLLRDKVPVVHGRLIHCSTHFTLTLGSLSLLFITFNRYLSVKFPFYYANHITEMKIYGCLAAILSVSVGLVIWVFIDGESESANFPVIISLIFSFTIIFQVMIFLIVRVQNHNLRRQIMAVQHNQAQISRMTRQTNAQHSKTNRTILYICFVFIATWLPSIIFRLYFVVHGNVSFYVQWLHLFNVAIQIHSCINPWLYVLRTSRIKQVLLRTFREE